MITIRTLTLNLTVFLVIAAGNPLLVAQAPPITASGASIAVRIAMDKDQVPLGQSPIATLTIWNTSDHVVYWDHGDDYRVHIEGKNGEPPKTLYYRQFLREPGLPDLAITLNAGPRAIWPAGSAADSIDSKFTLSAFYELDVPGLYSTYLEVLGESGKWLTTNTVQFEILATKP